MHKIRSSKTGQMTNSRLEVTYIVTYVGSPFVRETSALWSAWLDEKSVRLFMQVLFREKCLALQNSIQFLFRITSPNFQVD